MGGPTARGCTTGVIAALETGLPAENFNIAFCFVKLRVRFSFHVDMPLKLL